MTSDLFYICASITLVVLTTLMVSMFFMLNKSLVSLGEMLRELQRELSPMVNDVRIISVNMAEASEGLVTGLRRVNRLTEALANVGDDLEGGRQIVKGSAELLGGLAWPWLSKLKVFRRAFSNRS